MVSAALASLTGFVIAVISSGGYLGIVAMMAAESACIPLPSEVIMPFSGYLVSTGQMNLLLAVTAGAVGCNVGSAIAYEVAHRGGRRAVERWGRYLLVTKEELRRVERLFERHGGITVLLGRLLPVIRTFIAVPAGIAGMNRMRFQIYTFVGSWPWCFVLAWIGEQLGDKWNADPRVRELFHKADTVIVVVLVVAMVWWIWSRWRRSMRPS